MSFIQIKILKIYEKYLFKIRYFIKFGTLGFNTIYKENGVPHRSSFLILIVCFVRNIITLISLLCVCWNLWSLFSVLRLLIGRDFESFEFFYIFIYKFLFEKINIFFFFIYIYYKNLQQQKKLKQNITKN